MADVVVVMRVAAVDDHVAGLEHVGERSDRPVGDLARGHHHPHGSRPLEHGHELGERRCAAGTLRLQRLHRSRVHVVADAAVPVAHEAPHEVGAHPAEPHHAELHRRVRCHAFLSPRRGSRSVSCQRLAIRCTASVSESSEAIIATLATPSKPAHTTASGSPPSTAGPVVSSRSYTTSSLGTPECRVGAI